MDNIWQDPEILAVALLTIKVSGIATIISIILGIPLGLWLALNEFPGKKIIVSVVNFGMGLPPVVVGLVVSLMLWRYGPLGMLGIMYTSWAMIIAQAVIASPIVAGLSFAAIGSLNPKLRLQLLSLGASKWQANILLIRQAKLGLLAAVMAGFGGVVSEVGASMMVGGNIKGQTRVLTTATVMEVGKGNYDTALALSFILLVVAYGIVAALTYLQNRTAR
ncbi:MULTISPECIES: ABC transporter permease [Sporomusa]|jgi:tungstate transport system permease protein|uniref:Sulfate transport system permease protein CysW n=2 Tax=Sporomusa TaxID=2375 RepID=A0ABP2CAH7_9FIRM|nr:MULTISPECIES: ABC transporter permease [Sporomusa]MCM0758255.1 ABC transporter permease [Sporomusa sphaeroides DSM 2875]OLS57881.1 sulfate transport system permease protein CysW [Sporomusa sphaeroides DSM 2875]CVK20394.1 Sulfate transport system permease protein CysW [Sporomusa sphaeroides DSM 2875]SCM80741.1 ABC-type tungstate transport system, periplasmic component [uncultured Sporomusa sp.]